MDEATDRELEGLRILGVSRTPLGQGWKNRAQSLDILATQRSEEHPIRGVMRIELDGTRRLKTRLIHGFGVCGEERGEREPQFTFSKAVDVAQKAQKTSEFLCVAREFTIQNYQRVVDAYYEEQSQV